MDKHGIGTDATHADHIETVKQRQYIGITNNDKLVPGLRLPYLSKKIFNKK
jgi:DNA topoisomerase-3